MSTLTFALVFLCVNGMVTLVARAVVGSKSVCTCLAIVANPILSAFIDIFTLKSDRKENKTLMSRFFAKANLNWKPQADVYKISRSKNTLLHTSFHFNYSTFFSFSIQTILSNPKLPLRGAQGHVGRKRIWSCSFEARFVVNRFNTKATTLGPSCWKP